MAAGIARCASSARNRRSQHSATASPPPTAEPSIAAIVGRSSAASALRPPGSHRHSRASPPRRDRPRRIRRCRRRRRNGRRRLRRRRPARRRALRSPRKCPGRARHIARMSALRRAGAFRRMRASAPSKISSMIAHAGTRRSFAKDRRAFDAKAALEQTRRLVVCDRARVSAARAGRVGAPDEEGQEGTA